jgi:hypothetical protein
MAKKIAKGVLPWSHRRSPESQHFEQRRVFLAKLISETEHPTQFRRMPGESMSAMRRRLYEREHSRDMALGKVASYERAYSFGAEFPPVFVFDLGGKLFLHDGWHRCAAAALLGHDAISAVVFRIPSAEEGHLLSALLFDLQGCGTPWQECVRAGGEFLRAGTDRGVGEEAHNG